MSHISTYVVRFSALAIIAGGLIASVPSYATAPQGSAPTSSTAAMAPAKMTHSATSHKPEDHAQLVEARIKSLHDKLKITSAQEEEWADVANTMRRNEARIKELVQQRQLNAQALSAVDDLKSYAKITEAHLDGINDLISSFEDLYSDLSDEQKKAADAAFGSFQQHHDTSKKHK